MFDVICFSCKSARWVDSHWGKRVFLVEFQEERRQHVIWLAWGHQASGCGQTDSAAVSWSLVSSYFVGRLAGMMLIVLTKISIFTNDHAFLLYLFFRWGTMHCFLCILTSLSFQKIWNGYFWSSILYSCKINLLKSDLIWLLSSDVCAPGALFLSAP